MELFVAAEELGFDSAWVAQHHFDAASGRLPSPFTFLAAVAERTRRIHLGTAVVTLPLEDPVRVAEDAAVLDALSGGRVELGVGSGADPAVFTAFGKDLGRRREDNSAGVAALAAAFAGEPVGGTDFRLLPEAPGLGGAPLAGRVQPGGRAVRGCGRLPAAAEPGHLRQRGAHRRGAGSVGRGLPRRQPRAGGRGPDRAFPGRVPGRLPSGRPGRRSRRRSCAWPNG